ncbi:xanthine dehydrogenase accessory protein XdhC [Exilibacterium tricleocarpae]|uniref:Xanthine dehydrogenase accessory protein XdhC n=1 Tax=Exilibacterium tricleocarpae TaxID=2591008 RepID=A0A545U9Q4_9GAMM|nr:xanthine dehydrogenase accessory protein XdhC [Exilibacterium tricleocarpae]TQV86204.1 xanthine dehydrogenase accessory protein XdhC [Exilibacterium tricleocarpae]
MKSCSWYEAVGRCEAAGCGYVLATVMGAAGSTPREPASKMVISADDTFDTIGGGQLEFLVIQRARELLLGAGGQELKAFPLAAQARQCCGGHVSVLLETFAPCDWQLAIYGAGHVAQRLVGIVAELPCRITWVDNRADLFPPAPGARVVSRVESDPVATVAQLAPGTDVLILTHDHGLDFELSQAALERTDLGFIGLIGSQTKAQRFRRRLARAGVAEQRLRDLCCPVGLPEVSGKLPMEVAVSISAQLLALRKKASAPAGRRGIQWREMKTALATGEVPLRE